MISQPQLLIATTNAGKFREIVQALKSLAMRLVRLEELGGLSDVDEDQPTFMGNAEKKALHYARLSGLPTLADDSGLEVQALGGQPGVHSARFAGAHGDDGANNARLLALLKDIPPAQRQARFRCAMAIADGDRIIARAEGSVAGVIVDQARGQQGFGYDPHFLIPDLDRTAAELDTAVKNRISHRGQALRHICDALGQLLK